MEFALVAPLFFLLVFGIIDGGFMMYTANQADFATGVGMIRVTAAGRAVDADTSTVAAMRTTGGLGASALATVSEIDIYLLDQDASTGSLTADTNGCAGAPCINRYRLDGSAISVVWQPSVRNVTNFTSDFVGVTVKYAYRFHTGFGGTFNLSATRYGRLEPQT